MGNFENSRKRRSLDLNVLNTLNADLLEALVERVVCDKNDRKHDDDCDSKHDDWDRNDEGWIWDRKDDDCKKDRKHDKCKRNRKHHNCDDDHGRCEGCVCDILRRLPSSSLVNIVLKGGDEFFEDELIFASFDRKTCCATFILDGYPFIIDCEKIAGIQILKD
jgi:hypothetical protein